MSDSALSSTVPLTTGEGTEEKPNPFTVTESKAIMKWQQSLRWFMVGIVGFSLLLFAASIVSIYPVWQQAQQPLNVSMEFSPMRQSDNTQVTRFDPQEKLAYTEWATRTLLEKNLIERRYNQAKLTLITRTWISCVGFITGMLLALTGAAFVLGKLSDAGTEASGEGGGVKGSLKTSSPGLVLAVLGAVLMAITLHTDHKIEVQDMSTYLPNVVDVPIDKSASGTVGVLPPDITVLQKLPTPSPSSTPGGMSDADKRRMRVLRSTEATPSGQAAPSAP